MARMARLMIRMPHRLLEWLKKEALSRGVTVQAKTREILGIGRQIYVWRRDWKRFPRKKKVKPEAKPEEPSGEVSEG